ncbi:MAG: bifunctional UDP-N-acetylglucosamine diphosphorylase/glucosamine-1-phosphate N-acetyltransferase GlmU [Hyphomicrobiaceae bacterium]|nr:bifunctional UDP-N-acetylglucosamine diphosphorylase/glucosamine-1-phosphate N-acetyltransferase GlmU [Hyphomicrobiaceae bacterium]
MGSDMLTIVLAAGKGTRMKSEIPKPLHKVGGRTLLAHALASTAELGARKSAVVVGPEMEQVAHEARTHDTTCEIFVQANQRGTADAVLAARTAIADNGASDVLVLFCDTPLLRPQTLGRLSAALAEGAHVAVLGFEAADPTGYGRILTSADGSVSAIREHKDASAEELAVRLCNGGVMAFRCPDLLGLLDRIGSANAKGEFYLTDAIELARGDGLRVVAVTCAEEEVMGINDRVQLSEAEAVFQNRAREAAMRAGATLTAPETVWFSYDTQLGRDIVVEPNVFFGPGVVVEDGVTIHANCHFEKAHIGANAEIGPFARLRPGAALSEKVKIGNFVEVKNVTMGKGAKANHLAYLGDGSVGEGANIGAGTIFCNYDGYRKNKTTIGAGAFVGSNSSLVAPVTIGDGAYVGSGSVITKDVPADALSVERSEQKTIPAWAARRRSQLKKA